MTKTGCAALLALLLCLPGVLQAAGPKLVVEGVDFNFGQVYQGTKVEHTFRFRNAGDAPLVVEKVRSSCGCTAALASATTIPAGGSGDIRTTFDSGRFNGPVTKTVYLHVNDPQQPVAEFHLRGTVRPEMTLQPAQLDLGSLTVGATREARVTLTNNGDQELSFSAVESTAPELQAELTVSKLPPGKSAQLVVKVVPRPGKARLSGYVLVKTSSPRVPELRLPVYGSIGDNTPGR